MRLPFFLIEYLIQLGDPRPCSSHHTIRSTYCSSGHQKCGPFKCRFRIKQIFPKCSPFRRKHGKHISNQPGSNFSSAQPSKPESDLSKTRTGRNYKSIPDTISRLETHSQVTNPPVPSKKRGINDTYTNSVLGVAKRSRRIAKRSRARNKKKGKYLFFTFYVFGYYVNLFCINVCTWSG